MKAVKLLGANSARAERSSSSRPVQFKLNAPAAKQVQLAADFTEWRAGARPLRESTHGLWQTEVQLKPGRYQYKFIVDGQWRDDPQCAHCEPNPYGGNNNVVEVS